MKLLSTKSYTFAPERRITLPKSDADVISARVGQIKGIYCGRKEDTAKEIHREGTNVVLSSKSVMNRVDKSFKR